MKYCSINIIFISSLVISCLFLSGCFTQTPAPATHYGFSEGAGSTGAHTVREGDTLWSISKRYKLAMRDIVIYNNLQEPFELETGQRILLPAPQEYRVRTGDTLYSVSRLFDIQSSEIARLNNLAAPYMVRIGQTLRLPSRTDSQRDADRKVRKKSTSQLSSSPAAPEQKKPAQTASIKRPAPNPIQARTPKRSSNKFLRPVSGPVISSYGPKDDGLHNDGINIRAPKGTPVLAAENGVIVYAGNELKGSGNLILIRHADRWMTAYAHLDRILVKRGQTVDRGIKIGTVGATGSVDSPQLHFETRRGTDALNPKVYIGD